MKKQHGHKIETHERALLVQVILGRRDREEAEDSLLELERLADTAGAVVVGAITQCREKPTPGFFVGEGKLADIQLACREGRANLVIFDNDLSAIQVNNLDLALGIKIIDRTELILQIFARRARSAESQIQVELAQLQYLVSRIPISKKQHRFQGGIGMRGPGESPLQLRNAPMRKRIKDLKKKLELVQDRRKTLREKRKWPLVCLVGYTNVGKSTLLNAFAPANAYVDDRLFATLDTKTRLVYLPDGRNILMADTVGFIKHLPHGLIASFKSTLEIAADADLLLVVADPSHPRAMDQLNIVEETLKEIGADKVPRIVLMNKCDVPGIGERIEHLKAVYPEAIQVSAIKKDGLKDVKEQIIKKKLRDYAVHYCDADRKS